MITHWIHFEELAGDPWILPIYAAVNTAVDQGRYKRLPAKTYSLGQHVTTRLNLLPHVVARLNESCLSVYEKIKIHDEGHIFSGDKDGYVFRLDSTVKYLLIADINSLLFEANACTELIIEFAQALYLHVGRPSSKENILKDIKRAYMHVNLSPRWFMLLDSNRNFIAHNGTPYIAVDVSNPDYPTLLVMKDNVKNFDNPETFISMNDIQMISTGFTKTNVLLQRLLIDLFLT
jgi:hypothetical protein